MLETPPTYSSSNTIMHYVYDGHLYSRSNSNLSLEAQHTGLAGAYEGHESSGRRGTPSSDTDIKSSLAHRKRVPVACERCRKRKIKCSGDEGDGRACVNCRNAGYDGCQFLRVQSQRLSMDLPTSGSRHWQQQHRWSPYGSRFNLPFPLQPQYAFQQTSVPYTSWQPEIAYGGMSQGMGMPYARPSYSPTYTMYAPEAVDSHAGHPPSFMLPDMNQSAYANTATMHNLGRQQTAMWLDQINSVSLPNQTAHVAPTVYPLTPVESARPYTGLLGMPPTSLSPDRILPQPAVARPFLHTYSTRHDAEPLSAVSHRSSIGWTADTPSNVSYASSRTSCGDVYDITPVSSSVDCSGQTLTYAYDVTSASPHVEVPVLALPFTLDTAPQQTISDIRSQPMTNTEQALADTVSASVRTPRDIFPESHGRGKATKRNANSKLYRNILTQEREASYSWREPSSRTERDVPINDEAYPALGIALSASAT